MTGAENVDAACTTSTWLLLAPRVTLPLATMGAVDAKVVAALTVRMLLPPLVPNTVLPNALKALPAVTLTAALAVMGAANVVVACTVRVWLVVAPSITLPYTVRAALAIMGAVDAKKVTAFTVRVLLPLVPRTTFPSALNAFPAVMVAAALAVTGAEMTDDAKIVRS